MDRCLSREQIDRYMRQVCAPDEVKAIEAHLVRCSACRARVGSLRTGGLEPTVAVPTDVPANSSDPQMTQTAPTPAFYTDGRSRSGAPEITFEGYQILEELPQGGQAIVYKAVHKATKAKVALKVLLPGLLGSDKAKRYFEQEVDLAASLEHPNIVTIRDSGIAQGQYYFAMNYIHGKPLDRYLQNKNLSIRDIMALFARVCDAMAHAHRRGVIHRDLKPSNILVDERGEPHILDFGLAKTAAGMSRSGDTSIMPTITGQIKGTVAYMSPEQAAGRSDLLDVRTDVYSLGVVLYQMCTGTLPYDISGPIVEALNNIQHAEPKRPRQAAGRCDSDVEAIILKCLAKDPDQRYQSAAELKQDVQRWLDGLPIVAKSVSTVYLLRKIVSRHRYTATVLGSLLLTLCSVIFVVLHFYRRADHKAAALQKVVNAWTGYSTGQNVLLHQIIFRNFLSQWHDPKDEIAAQAPTLAALLATGTPERWAADFLLDPNDRKSVEQFRRRADLPSHLRWLADLLAAEMCLKKDDRVGASAGYLTCRRKMPPVPRDSVLKEYVEAQLYRVGPGRSGTAPGQPGAEDQP